MREYEFKITVQVMTDVERMTGVDSLYKGFDLLVSSKNLTALFYCAIKHQYPRLSYAKFVAEITPDELGAAYPALAEELGNFFQRFGDAKKAASLKLLTPAEPESETETETETE